MASTASTEVSRGRKIGAASSMLAAGGIVASEAVGHSHIEWMLLALAGILGAAGLGMTRRSLVSQILSRGAAWIVLFPTSLIAAFALAGKASPPLEVVGLAVGTGAALLLARPMLHTADAREAFAPKVFRRLFLAGSTASAATAFVAGGVALEVSANHTLAAGGFFALSLSLFASAVAVVRMRGWGILLGTATSALLLVIAAFSRQDKAMALALAAAPALLLHLLPVVLARLRSAPEERTLAANDVEPAFSSARYRIATTAPADAEVLELDAASSSEAACHPSRLARLRSRS